MSDTKFKSGESGNIDGRPVGANSKFTNLKAAWLGAFEKIGGMEALVAWVEKSERNKAQFFQMLTKMLPSSSTTGFDEATRQFLFELSEQFMPKKGKEEE